MRKDMKKKYDASISQMSAGFIRDITDLGYSSWKGPLRPQALFVDENACIGYSFAKFRFSTFYFVNKHLLNHRFEEEIVNHLKLSAS